MKFTWDETKRISNINKHTLDFAFTQFVFEIDTFTFEDKRMVYQEQRFITLGILNGKVWLLSIPKQGRRMR